MPQGEVSSQAEGGGRGRPAAVALTRRDGGAVLVITLLSAVLIASLVFYVFNVGRHIQKRVQTQNAADASAAAGAGWVARSMNTVAMNNVEMSRLIALVNVLDATDEAVHPAYHEVSAMHDVLLERVLRSGAEIKDAEAELLDAQMKPVIGQFAHDLALLDPIKRLFKAPSEPREYSSPSGPIDTTWYTFYDSAAGQGEIWRAIDSLDAFSQAVMENIGILAQIRAVEIGRENMHAEDSVAVLLPVDVELPWKRGRFDDFQRPVELGLLPAEIDDPVTRRGPYDVIFGWRMRNFDWETTEEGVWHAGDSSVGSGPPGQGGIGPRTDDRGYWDPPPQRARVNRGYRTYGPQTWMLNDLRYAEFLQTPFYGWRDQFARIKLNYLFHRSVDQRYRLPIWKTDWREIVQIADAGVDGAGNGRSIFATRFFITRIESAVRRSDSDFLSPGTYEVRDPGRILDLRDDWTVSESPCDLRTNDPRFWQAKLEKYREFCPQFELVTGVSREQWLSARYTRIDDWAWRYESKITRDGKEMWQYLYYIVLGVDVGQPVLIRNPHNFTDRDSLAAPIHLDHEALPANDEGARRQYLTFLAAAQQDSSSYFWPRQFDRRRPYADAVALAQARVFNNHSWDLWTQMWHAQLEPISEYPQWMDRLDQTAGEAASIPLIPAGRLHDLRQYLHSIDPLSATMLNH
jgi:hypothetical protein